jgi:glutaredoxin-related protein
MIIHFIMAVNYNTVIQESLKDLKESVRLRDHYDNRIRELSSALRGLSRLVPEGNREVILQDVKAAKRKSRTLAEAILELLTNAKNGMNAAEIREQLEESGFDIEEYSQPLGSIMTAAQRLVPEKLEKETTEERGIIFRLVGEK